VIHIDLLTRDVAVVIFEPTILQRLLLQRSSERMATRLPDIGGSYVWLYDNGHPVSEAVRRAINAEVVRVEWRRILAK
jgi:hypothetical protein